MIELSQGSDNYQQTQHLFKQRSRTMKAIRLEVNKIANLAGLITPKAAQ